MHFCPPKNVGLGCLQLHPGVVILQWDRKRVACPFWVGREVLPQVEEFKYLGVLLWLKYWTIVVKKEPSQNAKI